MLKVGPPFYTAAAPLYCVPASYCHLSATLQTISNSVANFQENRAVFRFFVALLKFLFEPPTYVIQTTNFHVNIYRMSQEKCARLREGVPCVKVYRYNPKHLCPKLNGYGDNGQRSMQL